MDWQYRCYQGIGDDNHFEGKSVTMDQEINKYVAKLGEFGM